VEAFILSEVEQGVMTITLNRPDRLNSFNDLMHQQLAACLKQAERDDSVRCLLMTGAGRGFCAGQDLNDRNVDPSGPAPDLGLSVERFYNPGAPSGGAAETGDLRGERRRGGRGGHAGAGLRYRAGGAFGEVRDGVQQARSGAGLRRQLVSAAGGGRARAMGLALLGDSLSAEQAAQWGMIWQVVDDAELKDTSLALARHLAAQPTYGLGLIKRRCGWRKPRPWTSSLTWSAIISAWPDAAPTIAKASALFWRSVHLTSAGNSR
jgi:2-(1,2-epoxy-1,2-dihydrophenyl)acetyl-CoA isomerase